MWVDKYKPLSLKNVVGQSGDKSNANKLLKWLREWFVNHSSSDEKVKAAWQGLRDPEGKTFKAALLSGPPGIGKTTVAHLCVKQVGYDYFELNASDTRNKNGLHGMVGDSLNNRTMFRSGDRNGELTSKLICQFLIYVCSYSLQFQKPIKYLIIFPFSTSKGKHVVIMDEVDGMSGNEDRGGIQELITLIKKSRVPIICICNDRNHQKIRSLAGYCFDLK
jgi:replication factor C subunit 1